MSELNSETNQSESVRNTSTNMISSNGESDSQIFYKASFLISSLVKVLLMSSRDLLNENLTTVLLVKVPRRSETDVLEQKDMRNLRGM